MLRQCRSSNPNLSNSISQVSVAGVSQARLDPETGNTLGEFQRIWSGTPGSKAPEAPHLYRIGGYWYPRGGIPIDVFWQAGTLPKGVWLPDSGVASYRGRG